MVFRRGGGMVVVKERGIYTVQPKSGALKLLPTRPRHAASWFNDCKCDRQGNLWTGRGDRGKGTPTGNLLAREPARQATKVDSRIICPNGPAFSPDGRNAYFADSYARRIFRYEVDPSGKVGARHPSPACRRAMASPTA